MAEFNVDGYLSKQKKANEILLGEITGSGNKGNALSADTLAKINQVKEGIGYGLGAKNPLTAAAATNSASKNLVNAINNLTGMAVLANIQKFGTLQNAGGYFPGRVTTDKRDDSGGSSGAVNTPNYQPMLDDLYNKVMGYGGYTAGTYTPSSFASSVDTTGIQNQLAGWLNEIDNYEPFKYDLNGDMLYKQMADNYIQQGQLAMQDTMANAAALTGGYGNSYAASVGNQAFQQHLTQLNNNIPALQAAALNVWRSGEDQLIDQYNAGSMQLDNLLAIRAAELAAWQAQEAMNFDAWSANEQNAYNEWLAGYSQAQDQYELAKDYYGTLEAMQKSIGGSGGGSSSSKTSGKTSSTTPAVGAVLGSVLGQAVMTNPTVNWVELLVKANTKK